MSRRTGAHKQAAKPAVEEGNSVARAWWASDRFFLLVSAAALAVSLAIYLLRIDHVIGMAVDDAWYVLLAKALASGEGYRLINAPTPGIMPFYPPGFPFLLSFVFRVAPDFPANLTLLKSVSVAAALGAGAVTVWYYARLRACPRYLALAIAAAVVLAPPLVFAATGMVLSEPVFMLAQMLAVAFVERGMASGEEKGGWRWILLGGLLAGFAFLVRSMAVALVAAGVAYLLWRRRWRQAALFAAMVAIVVGPWMIHSRIEAPTEAQRREQNGYIVYDYATQFWQRRAGAVASGTVTIGDLPARAGENLGQILLRDMGEILAARLYYELEDSGGSGGFSFLLALFILAGYIAVVRQRLTMAEFVVPFSLAIILLWPWETMRFVLPLSPFLFFYLLVGLRLIFHLHLKLRQEELRPAWTGLTVVALLFIALHVYGNINYLRRMYAPPAERPELMRAFEENREMLEWMRERLPADAVVATQNPPLVYLLTGRKTIALDNPAANWETWNRLNVRYLAYVSALRIDEPSLSEQRYTPVYRSRGELNLRVVDLGPPDTREPWGVLTRRPSGGFITQ